MKDEHADMEYQAPPPVVEQAAASPPPVAARLRVWPSVVLGLCAPVVLVVISSFIVVLALFATPDGRDALNSGDVDGWTYEFASTPGGFALLVVPVQCVLLSMAMGAAFLSGQHWRGRLMLSRGRHPLWTWPILMIATLGAGAMGSLLTVLLTDGESDQLDMIFGAMASAAGWQMLLMLVVISFIPGVVEEVFFRGYVQSRLLRRWPPVLAIAFSTLTFTLIHIDPVHMLGVIPVGAWLGVVAWRTASVVPAIGCHIFNNAVALVLTLTVYDHTSKGEEPIWMYIAGGVLLAGGIATLVFAGRKT